MKNPLALFTGAALATLAALAGLNMTDWPGGLSDSQKPAEAAGQAGEIATPPAEQKPAAEEVAETPEKPTEMAAIPAPEPPKAETGADKPELDTVRVESDGQAIVAGRAKPGAEVALKLGDQVIGKGVVNSDGSWVVVPDQPLPKGAHEITIEQKAADAAPVTAEQSIAVAVPEKPSQQAMVALTEPGTATRVLQSGGNQEQASLTEPAPQPGADQPKTPETTDKPAEPAQVAQEPPKADEPAVAAAEKPAEGTAPAGAAEQPAPQNTTVAKTEAQEQEELPDAVKPPEPTPAKPQQAETAQNVPMGLDAVDYNDKGDIIFSGRAKPGTTVRLYVDNRAVGDALADAAGTWTFAGKRLIAPGTHDLRVDQIDKAGKVIARVELPFLRENAEAVAALNPPPEPGKIEAEPQPEASATEPAAEPPAQKTAEPKPEASETQPVAEPPAQKTAEPSPQQSAEPPQTTTAEAPQTTTAEAPETTAEPAPQTTAEPAPQASAPEPAKTAEAEPSQTKDITKAEPQASSPAPAQPTVGEKKPEETTTAATEQAAQAIDAINPRPGKIVIQPGNNLWKLSRIIYGRGKNYTVIYQANKGQIRSPGRIYPGQIFAIPGALPPEMIDPKRKDPLTSAEGGAAQQ